MDHAACKLTIGRHHTYDVDQSTCALSAACCLCIPDNSVLISSSLKQPQGTTLHCSAMVDQYLWHLPYSLHLHAHTASTCIGANVAPPYSLEWFFLGSQTQRCLSCGSGSSLWMDNFEEHLHHGVEVSSLASVHGALKLAWKWKWFPEYMLCRDMDGWSKMQLAFCSFSLPPLANRFGSKVLAFVNY